MSDSNAKTVRGLSIAVLVLSILSIVTMVFLLVFFSAALSDPFVINSLSYELNDSLDYHLNINIQTIMMLIFTIMGIFVIWPVACSAVTIVAAILGIRNCNDIAKLGSVFGWTLAGIVFSLLCGRLITAILLIISAVYINKLRKTPVVPYGQPPVQ